MEYKYRFDDDRTPLIVSPPTARERLAESRRREQERQNRARNIAIGCGLVLAAGLAGLAVWGVADYRRSTSTHTAHINRVADHCSGTGKSYSCQTLVYTSDGVFANNDSLLAGKRNSSDFTNELCPGSVVEFVSRGWRVPWMSWYPNIIKIDRVVTPAPANLECQN